MDRDSPQLPALEAILDEAGTSKGKIVIITSVLSQVEVAYSAEEKAGRALIPEELGKIDALWGDDSVIKLVEVHELVVSDARRLIRAGVSQGLKLKPADAIHLATARGMNVRQFCTYDGRISSSVHEELTGLTIAPPRTANPRLL